MFVTNYIIRLDDACPTMKKGNSLRIEKILDSFSIKPIVSVIPDNKDKTLNFSEFDKKFWLKVKSWQEKNWIIGLHGFQHSLVKTASKSILHFYDTSEFTGYTLIEQRDKIQRAINIFSKNNIEPKIWVAPKHTFNNITLTALKQLTKIKTISDGLAVNHFTKDGFTWIPAQLWNFRKMPFGTWTFCLHPNTMKERDFIKMTNFIKNNRKNFIDLNKTELFPRKVNIIDKLFESFFWFRRKIKSKIIIGKI